MDLNLDVIYNVLKGVFMLKEYWFDERILGIGFGMPLTIEGWLALIGLFVMLGLSMYVNEVLTISKKKNDLKVLKDRRFWRFLMDIIIIVSVFTALFHDRVKGGLVWNFL